MSRTVMTMRWIVAIFAAVIVYFISLSVVAVLAIKVLHAEPEQVGWVVSLLAAATTVWTGVMVCPIPHRNIAKWVFIIMVLAVSVADFVSSSSATLLHSLNFAGTLVGCLLAVLWLRFASNRYEAKAELVLRWFTALCASLVIYIVVLMLAALVHNGSGFAFMMAAMGAVPAGIAIAPRPHRKLAHWLFIILALGFPAGTFVQNFIVSTPILVNYLDIGGTAAGCFFGIGILRRASKNYDSFKALQSHTDLSKLSYSERRVAMRKVFAADVTPRKIYFGIAFCLLLLAAATLAVVIEFQKTHAARIGLGLGALFFLGCLVVMVRSAIHQRARRPGAGG